MNEIFFVGLILMAAVLAGHLAQLVRVPEVTGYLLVGVAIGPSALELISHENLTALGFLSEVALGLILFNIGSIFEASNFRRVGRGVVRVTLWEATLAFVLVFITLLMLGMNWPLAVLLAVVAMETAPATTLMVLNDDAKGPMTERLLALVALNNMYVLVTFGIVSAALTFVQPSQRRLDAERVSRRPRARVDDRRIHRALALSWESSSSFLPSARKNPARR